jgi:hypothetical protein
LTDSVKACFGQAESSPAADSSPKCEPEWPSCSLQSASSSGHVAYNNRPATLQSNLMISMHLSA